MDNLRLWVAVALLIGLAWDLALRIVVDMFKHLPGQIKSWLQNKRAFILKRM